MIENLHTKWFNEHLDEIESFIRSTLSSKVIEGTLLTILYSDGESLKSKESEVLSFKDTKNLVTDPNRVVVVILNGKFILQLIVSDFTETIQFIGLSYADNVGISVLEIKEDNSVGLTVIKVGNATQEDVDQKLRNTFVFNEETNELTIQVN